jgi:hypothetical protein
MPSYSLERTLQPTRYPPKLWSFKEDSMPRRPFIVFAVPVLLSLILAACNMPGLGTSAGQQATEDANATAAAETVAAELTRSAGQLPTDSPTAAATNTPPASATPAGPTATPVPTGCTDRASFLSDVTVPDDTYFEPGEDFTKTWRLRNTGTCTWTTQYKLVFDSGRSMDGPASQPLSGNVPPNSTVDLSVDLEAPASNGTYRGNWLLQNATGVNFGIGANANVAFWVQIVVGPTPTPAPSVYKTAKIELKPSFHVDLDEGESPADSNADRDLWYESISAVERYLTPVNDAEAFLWTDGVPDFEDCDDDGELSDDRIDFDDFEVGDWLCFQTSEGRIGRFEIEKISGANPPVLTIDIRTWK